LKQYETNLLLFKSDSHPVMIYRQNVVKKGLYVESSTF